MKRPGFTAVVVSAAFALVVTACAGEKEPKDLLTRIQEDGVIGVVTDPAQPPESVLNNETGEFEGFNVDVGEEIARRLGVTVRWETAPVGDDHSGELERQLGHERGVDRGDEGEDPTTLLTPTYFLFPAAVAVHVDNTTITDTATDLDGKRIGVPGGSAHELLLQKTLYITVPIPGFTFDPQSVFIIDDAEIVTYETECTAIQNLALGDGVRLDAVMAPQAALQAAINAGSPIKIVGDPIFAEPLAVAIDRSARLDPTSLVERVSQIIQKMAQDGSFRQLALPWYDQLVGEVEVEEAAG